MRYTFSIYLLLLISASSFSVPCAAGGVIPIEEIFEPAPARQEEAEYYDKVAVVQWAPVGFAPLTQDTTIVEDWKMRNRKHLEAFVREAASKGAKLIILPEFGTVGYPDIPGKPDSEDNFENRLQLQPYVETVPGRTTDYFGKIARELEVYIHVGMAEVDPITDHYHNTVFVVGPDGKLITKYRKIHLFNIEENYLVAGNELVTYVSPWGKVGLIICSDVYSGFPMDKYRDMKLDVMALSTSWTVYNGAWTYFVRGARWVGATFLAANQNYFPDSGIINKDGTVQSHIRQTTGVAYGYLVRNPVDIWVGGRN